MKILEFVKSIRKSVIDSNFKNYQKIFSETKINEASDEYWKNALNFYNGLNQNEKDIFFSVIRQVEVDTVAKLFAIIDGISLMENQRVKFILAIEGTQERLNGGLTDVFLEIEN